MDDFGRDIPRDSYKEAVREERQSEVKPDRAERAEREEHKADKVEEKAEQATDKADDKSDQVPAKEPETKSAEAKAATTEPAPTPKASKKKKKKTQEVEEPAGDSDEEFQRMMGMSSASFGTTKHKKVAGNQVGAVSKPKATQYRQYMNRVGGFNRALSPERKS